MMRGFLQRTAELVRTSGKRNEFRSTLDLPDSLPERVQFWRRGLSRREFRLEDILEDALATVSEASFRAVGLRPYPEQLQGARVLTQNSIAEMATGEGKTLVTALGACVLALEGRGVHVATVNQYLAERDYEFASKVAAELGLTVGLLAKDASRESKRAAYACDITYGTGYEFGFDYLRDQLILLSEGGRQATRDLMDVFMNRPEKPVETVQRALSAAIVDEMDSVLIDEACSPLVLSQASRNRPGADRGYRTAHQLALKLKLEQDFKLERQGRHATLTLSGKERIHAHPGIPWDDLLRPWQNYVLNAIVAIHGYKRDEHYIVKDDKAVIVDEFTGRAHAERSWQSGLHQAVAAAENLPIPPENETSGTVTRQRYFRLYPRLSGLTGTAKEATEEFRHFFNLTVVPIPLHRPSRREILPERDFETREAMLEAVVEEIRRRHATGQPVLVGTRTVRMSEDIAARLTKLEVPHRVLNAMQDEHENEIVAHAGEIGSVVIATNMAGRGTHIDIPQAARDLGGLHVIGVELNESVRIDSQLEGRADR